MDKFLFFLMLFIVSLLLIGIPFLLSYWIYRFIKRKQYNSKHRLIALLPFIAVGYFVFDAIYPSEGFYRVDFKEVTGIELISTAYFHHKDASYPDMHGDYTSVAIVEVGSFFYEKLSGHLLENGFEEDNRRIGGKEMTLAFKRLDGRKVIKEFSKHDSDKFYYVAFLSDKETLLVQRTSW